MTAKRFALLSVLALGVWVVPEVRAHVLGGGTEASDCYLTFEGIEGTAPVIECPDGGSCDADSVSGQCTFPLSVCVFSPEPGCTLPTTVTALKGAAFLLNRPTVPATAAACGAPNQVVVKLKKNGKKAGKKKIKMAAITDGSPKKDPDKFKLVCTPSTTPPPTPVPGDRTFSVRYTLEDPMGSHFYSSATPGVQVDNGFEGAIKIRAGTPDANGVATLEVVEDSYVIFFDIGNGADCLKITAAGSTGKLDCDGGTPVGTKTTIDSGGPGPSGPDGPFVSTFELGAPGRPGDGYIRTRVEASTCGGVLGTQNVQCPNSPEDCANPDLFDNGVVYVFDPVALTTGVASAEVTNARQGSTPTQENTGVPFDCDAFVGENGPGTLVIPLPLTNIELIASDVANTAVIDD